MDMNKYLVTYLSDYPCGHRHALSMEIHALGVSDAIEKSEEMLADTDTKSTNHTLYSVVPVGFGESTLAEINLCPPKDQVKLLPCPFCGNDEVELNYSRWDGEDMFVIHCDCCGATQPEDYQDTAVRVWNQRKTSTTEAK
ncbi:Lar family restriction alleviation protein [Providencia stuartii]|uniref:Lar family restriction alleviation protein n=1 Tax=Providencia stuartii TaxID=588 RepID=UPI0023B0F02B|nr:Lar family restriction alleviation protein [Providencia thailandensis]MDE8747557.1 Lar family restriction alleviation protein [Providencia thailandensis]MDE8766563.1 Lar family restriction alleviation protein [Providencia thailandensis]MDE8778622.1 Lar family restriction alleviation protein [Providencia thailandensis]MDE8783028.1 Lar family restriction alleviation protein [Providencia thailandensis]MDE8787022.1 Lar family restriction alleviation protein [Providencia thailandensis]